jgi:hypothetical protein
VVVAVFVVVGVVVVVVVVVVFVVVFVVVVVVGVVVATCWPGRNCTPLNDCLLPSSLFACHSRACKAEQCVQLKQKRLCTSYLQVVEHLSGPVLVQASNIMFASVAFFCYSHGGCQAVTLSSMPLIPLAIHVLTTVLHSWLLNGPRKMERAAFVKDVQALITTAPQLPARLNPQEAEVALDLLAHTRTLLHFLKHDCVQVLQQHSSAEIVLSSPYAGGCQVNEVGSMYDAGVKHSHITVATLNPGRTGFSQLGSDSLLHWRLWAVASALEDQNIDVCGLPGARLPPGAILPSGLPYAWYGVRSSHWDSVGVFVKLEMQESFVPLDEHCCDRVFWFMITKGTRGQGHQTELLGCAFYARPGGDRETWQMIADTYRTLRSKHTTAKFVLFGDANCHLS